MPGYKKQPTVERKYLKDILKVLIPLGIAIQKIVPAVAWSNPSLNQEFTKLGGERAFPNRLTKDKEKYNAALRFFVTIKFFPEKPKKGVLARLPLDIVEKYIVRILAEVIEWEKIKTVLHGALKSLRVLSVLMMPANINDGYRLMLNDIIGECVIKGPLIHATSPSEWEDSYIDDFLIYFFKNFNHYSDCETFEELSNVLVIKFNSYALTPYYKDMIQEAWSANFLTFESVIGHIKTWSTDKRIEPLLTMFYGLDGQEPLNLEEVGKKVGVTRERIRQIKEKAIRVVRHATQRTRHESFYDKNKGRDFPINFQHSDKRKSKRDFIALMIEQME